MEVLNIKRKYFIELIIFFLFFFFLLILFNKYINKNEEAKFIESLNNTTSILLVGVYDKPIELKNSEMVSFIKNSPINYKLKNIDKIYKEENKQIVFYKDTYELARFNLIRMKNDSGFQIGNSYYIAKYQYKYYFLNEMQCNILSNYINDTN